MLSKHMKKLLSLLMAFAMVFGMIATAQPMQADAAAVDIAVSNGDFENGAFGGAVTGSGGAQIVEKQAYEGNYAVQLNARGTSVFAYKELAAATTEETTYKLSFRAKVLGGSSGNSVNYGFFALNSSGSVAAQKYGAGYPVPGGDWKEITWDLTAPAGTKTVKTQIYLGSDDTVAIIDNVSITDADGNELINDGGFETGKGAVTNAKYMEGTDYQVLFTPVHAGDFAAHVQQGTASGNGMVTATVSLKPSTEARTLKLNYWMYAVSSVNSLHNGVFCYDTSTGSWNKLSQKYGAQYATPGVWTQKTLEIAVAAGTNTLQIQMYASDAGAEAYIDDLTLTEEVAAVNHNVTLSFDQVTTDGTWKLNVSEAPVHNRYKVSAVIDGTACEIALHYTGGQFLIYPNAAGFTKWDGAVPTKSLEIPAGAVMKYVDTANGWAEVAGADTLTVTQSFRVENILGKWVNMSPYADVTFTELSAADLNVYKAEDQSASQSRSTFAIEVLNGIAIGNEGWQNFTKVAAKVLVDGLETSAVFGMVPANDAGWGKESAFLVYVTGDADAATNASSITICAGTTLVSPVDATKGIRFAEDFVMYKNCNSSWDITVDTHVYDQQNTDLEGAMVSAATCQAPATYYYSCSCGAIGTETFAIGELGEHSYVNGTCSVCGDTVDALNTTIAFQTVVDGTWQLVPGVTPTDAYYEIPVMIDGVETTVLAGYSNGLLLIYPDFFRGNIPQESFVIPANTMLKAISPDGGWHEIENAQALLVTAELEIQNIAGKWFEMSKYANVPITNISSADLDVYYEQYLTTEGLSAAELAYAKQQYPELFEAYGDDPNMTTIGIKSINANIVIPNNASWPNFTVLGNISVAGATPKDTYVMMTPDSSLSSEHSTAMDSAFLLRFFSGQVGELATSVTIQEGTILITADGTQGFRFTEDFVIIRNSDNTWDKQAPSISSANLTLGSILNLNVKVIGVNGATIRATIGSNIQNISAVDGVYTVVLPAHCLHESVILELLSGDTVLDTEIWTMEDYAATLRQDYASNTKMMALLTSLENYGTYAAYYANPTGTAPAVTAVEAVTRENLEAYKLTVATKDTANLRTTASLYLDDACDIRIKLNAEAFSGCSLLIDGTEVTTTTVDGKACYTITELLPQDWSKMYLIQVENGNGEVIFACQYSVLSYAYSTLGLTNEAQTGLNGLLKAIFLYAQAANDYLAN